MTNIEGKWPWTFRIVPGLVLISLTLILATGCWPANTTPVASFAVSVLTGPAPLTVIFDALSSYDSDGVILTYSWDYGDGSTGSGDEVSHTYATEGSYTVTLEVTDNGGKIASTQKGLTVLPPETQVPDPPEGGGGTCG